MPVNPRYQRWRVTTFGITWLIYGGLYFTRQAFSVAKIDLEGGGIPGVHLTRQQMGRIDSTYLATYMVGQFVFGALGDRFGPRKLLLAGMVLSVLAAVGSGYSSLWWGFLLFAILQGIAQSTGWSNTSKVMSSWFSVPERGRVVGWWCTHYTVGSAISLAFAGWAVKHFGSNGAHFWPAAFWASAAVVAVIAVLSYFFLVNKPEDLGLPPIEQVEPDTAPVETDELVKVDAPEGSFAAIREVLSSPGVWLLAIAYFPVKLVRYTFMFWGPLYVKDSLGSDIDASGLIAAAMPWGGLVGVVAIGYVSDRWFQSRRAPATVLSLLAAAAVIGLGFLHIESKWMMSLFFFLVGAFLYGPDSIISATASMDFGSKRGAGTATGFVNGVGSAGSILGGILPGQLATGASWSPLFIVMFLGLFASAMVLLPLWRTRPPTA